MSPARARTWTARSGDGRTNHEATAPPKTCFAFVITSPLRAMLRMKSAKYSSSQSSPMPPFKLHSKRDEMKPAFFLQIFSRLFCVFSAFWRSPALSFTRILIDKGVRGCHDTTTTCVTEDNAFHCVDGLLIGR